MLLVGKATRLARFLEGAAKEYEGVARLGVTTDTDDRTGTVTGGSEPTAWPERAAVEAAMTAHTGRYLQAPPAYSARRIGGHRSYALARAGAPVEPVPTPVEVERFACLAWEPPHLRFAARVSAGTYIRALARDLGQTLGVGAHLTELRRTAIGRWRVEAATPWGSIRPGMALIEPAELLEDLPGVALDAAEAGDVAHGRMVRRAGTSGRGRLLYQGRLVAVGEARPEGWQPIMVLEGA